MSIASDILKAAAQRMHEVSEAHAKRVGEVADRFKDHIGKPWKFKADAIREAQAIAEEVKEEKPAE